VTIVVRVGPGSEEAMDGPSELCRDAAELGSSSTSFGRPQHSRSMRQRGADPRVAVVRVSRLGAACWGDSDEAAEHRMTANKDFKRIVRARSQRTGESYAQALRQLRDHDAAREAAGKEPLMKITRAFPDIRSDDIEASRAFYSGLLGFDVSMEREKFLLFTSPSDPNIQVSLNGDFDSLPAGFIVDVGTGDRVLQIHAAAVEHGLRIIEPIDDKSWGIRRFSVLDPSGSRVTVLTHIGGKD
jgi:catechol 2,3-dioxygenase-like lactoylglutathione lyase family enzyme